MEWRNERTCDVLNLILGAFLLISPWIVGFDSGVQTQNAVICGLIIAVLSIAALSAFFEWEEWLNLIVGLWVLVSPWVLGFTGTAAAQVHFIVGILVAVIAAVELWMTHHPGRLTVSR
jgi:SPW repeat